MFWTKRLPEKILCWMKYSLSLKKSDLVLETGEGGETEEQKYKEKDSFSGKNSEQRHLTFAVNLCVPLNWCSSWVFCLIHFKWIGLEFATEQDL